MKTNDLIDLLATGAGPAPRGVAARRLAPAAALGALASAAGALGVLGPIPMELFVDPGPWLKLAYAGGLAVGAAWLAARLGRPVARIDGPVRVLLLVVALMALLGALALLAAPPGGRLAALSLPWPGPCGPFAGWRPPSPGPRVWRRDSWRGHWVPSAMPCPVPSCRPPSLPSGTASASASPEPSAVPWVLSSCAGDGAPTSLSNSGVGGGRSCGCRAERIAGAHGEPTQAGGERGHGGRHDAAIGVFGSPLELLTLRRARPISTPLRITMRRPPAALATRVGGSSSEASV